MASMRDIKRRKTSIQGTQQITKAMKLVSTVKLQRARAGAERSQTYFDCMYDTVNNILSRVGHLEHKYLVPVLPEKGGHCHYLQSRSGRRLQFQRSQTDHRTGGLEDRRRGSLCHR